MVLYSERVRRNQRDARETAGEDLWTESVPKPALVKIAAAWEGFQRSSPYNANTFAYSMGSIIKRESGRNIERVFPANMVEANTVFALDCIGALYLWVKESSSSRSAPGHFETVVNAIFEDYRVAFRMVDGEIIPFKSDELHTEVVVPALRLLVSERFDNAHRAYLDAIKEVPSDPSDAITDAGTALQEMLTALGCDGNNLGRLITSAKKKGLLAPHDASLAAGIKSFLDWASADRSEKGDGHQVSAATRADAWLMIHIVGALIVRLADPAPRSDAE